MSKPMWILFQQGTMLLSSEQQIPLSVHLSFESATNRIALEAECWLKQNGYRAHDGKYLQPSAHNTYYKLVNTKKQQEDEIELVQVNVEDTSKVSDWFKGLFISPQKEKLLLKYTIKSTQSTLY